MFDYGTVNNGSFMADVTIGVGGTVTIAANAGNNGTWGPLGAETLGNPLPAGASVRARLQQQQADMSWTDMAAAYQGLIVQAGGGIGGGGGLGN